MKDSKDLLTYEAAAAHIGCCEKTVRNLIARGDLEIVSVTEPRLGRRIRLEDVERVRKERVREERARKERNECNE